MKVNINLGVVGLLIIALGAHVAYAYFSLENPRPPGPPMLVPIQVGKTKTYVSQTRDASMFTERARRTAIISNPDGTYGHKGSTNGSLEWNFLTAICVCPPRKEVCPPAPNVIWSDGDADDEICDNVDAGGALGVYDIVDFGGAGGNDCDI
jgi:hypothetical protein